MTHNSDLYAEKDRENLVVKSNEIIRGKEKLSLQHKRVLLYAISKIKPGDTPATEYEVRISDIVNACGLVVDSGTYYKIITGIFKQLVTREWGLTPDGSLISISWLADVAFPSDRPGVVRFTFHKDMMPHLFDLSERYTAFKLGDILVMSSVISMKLFEILTSYAIKTYRSDTKKRTIRHTEKQIDLPTLRDLLNAETSYPRWSDFKRFVLVPAIDEINLYCEEMHIEMEPIMHKRSVIAVKFILDKPTPDQLLSAQRMKTAQFKKRKRDDGGVQMDFMDIIDDYKASEPYVELPL